MLDISTIDVLAIILIAIAVIKIIVFLYKPSIWFNIIENIYKAPLVVSVVGSICSVTTLYLLIKSGITIVEILAVSLFLMLLMITGCANYADQIVGWAKGQNIAFMIKRLWIYSLAWVLLIIWGILELTVIG
jgi:hypothetical protein